MDYGLSPHCPLTNSKGNSTACCGTAPWVTCLPVCNFSLFTLPLSLPSRSSLFLSLPHLTSSLSPTSSQTFFLSVTKINSAAAPHSPHPACQILSSSKLKGQIALSIEKKKKQTKIAARMPCNFPPTCGVLSFQSALLRFPTICNIGD